MQSLFYKYTDHHAIDVLKDLRLKVTPPNEFNDPFEFLPHISASLTIGKAKKKLKDKTILKKLYEQWTSGGYTGTFKQLKNDVASSRDFYANLMLNRFGIHLAKYRHKFQDSVSIDHGVLCLSKNPSSILMWSHYADSHRGAVIAFKADHPFFTADELQPVDYIDERVPFDPTWFAGSPNLKKYASAIIRRKSSQWSYEEEIRILFRLEFCTRLPKGDQSLYFYGIPPDLIAKVIFGLRCPCEKREQLKSAARKQGLQVQFEEARLHGNKFGLTFHSVSG